jgi:hypothetical protein
MESDLSLRSQRAFGAKHEVKDSETLEEGDA